MANYSAKDLVISCDDSGGTPRTITTYIREVGGFKISQILAESQSFGDTWFESLATGINKGDDLTLGGFYDDAATTGPNVLFSTMTGSRTVVLTWGAAKTSTFEALVVSYERLAKINDMTMFQVVLRPTGSIVEA